MNTARKPYPSDLSDEERSLIVPYLLLMKEDAEQSHHDLQELFNGLRYVIRDSIAWRAMPNDLSPWSAVYQQSRRWMEARCFEALVHDLRAVLRLAAGKKAEPTTAIIDSRTLRSTPESGLRSAYDGAKRKNGSKLHMAVDTPGHLPALHITPANRDDRAETGPLAEAIRQVTDGSVELAWADQGYTGSKPAKAAKEQDITSKSSGCLRKTWFCIAAPTVDRREIFRMGDTMQKARKRLRALRLNACRNAHHRIRWLHAEKRSQPAHARCITPSRRR